MPMAKGDTGDRSAEKAQTAKLYHKFQVILNKLTPQMFQTLAEQALKLEINTEERLSGCTNMIFTKVCSSVHTELLVYHHFLFYRHWRSQV